MPIDPLDQQLVEAVLTRPRRGRAELEVDGRVVRLSTIEIPPLAPGTTGLSSGAPLGALLDLPRGESVVGLTTLDESGALALATANGVVKRHVTHRDMAAEAKGRRK